MSDHVCEIYNGKAYAPLVLTNYCHRNKEHNIIV